MIFARLLMLSLLVVSAFVTWRTLGSTPAFNPRLLSETIVGDSRTAISEVMYDPGAYHYQRGYGFLMADTIISADTEAEGEIAAPEVAQERATKAAEALQTAVSLDPGNAHAWAALAWARARLGDRKGSADALRVSWQVAPNNRVLAETRVNLAGLLSYPGIATGLTDSDYAAISNDMSVLSRFAPRVLALYTQVSPHLSQLAGDPDQN